MDIKNPIEIDTALAEYYDRQYEARGIKVNYELSVEYAKKYFPSNETKLAEALERVRLVDNLLNSIKDAIANLEKLYTGWNRAFLVSNANGHIHSSMSCATCFDTTRFIWLPNLSGEDRMKIAELAGESACTICYPDAPSEYFLRKSQLEDPSKFQAREEREAKKQKREAKALATGITNPDGTPLTIKVGRYPETIKTERTAQIWAVDNLYWIGQYPEGDSLEQRKQSHEIVLVALAHKRGTSVEEQRALIQKKSAIKFAF